MARHLSRLPWCAGVSASGEIALNACCRTCARHSPGVASIRRHIGEALRDLQKGAYLGMPLSRPMTTVAAGVHELRVRGEGTQVRVFYCVRFMDRIIVFHAFQKKAHKTPLREIRLARHRLQEVLDEAIEC